MKIQIATTNIIETFNPTGIGRFGYSISRMALNDSTVTFSVRCIYYTGNIFSNEENEANQNAHMAAHFIEYGEANPKFIYR